MIVARANPQAPTDEGWRGRVRAVAERGARAVASHSIAALSDREGLVGAEVLVLVPEARTPSPNAPGTPSCARCRPRSPGTRSRSAVAE